MTARIIALAALVAVAAADGHFKIPDSASTTTFGYPSRLTALEDVETGCMPSEVSDKASASITGYFAERASYIEGLIERQTEAIESQQTKDKEALEKEMASIDQKTTEDLDALEKELTETTEALEAAVEKSIANLTAAVASALDNYAEAKTMANDTGSYKWKSNYALVAAAQAGADTENGHAGRMMYKIEYNPNNPGYFHPGGPELKASCKALSDDLASIDGIDRALKPAADVDWASDGDSVRLQGSYLSNCGCGGHPRQRQCVGMSNNFLAGGVMYNRYNSWWGCKYLRHDGRDCHHHWSNCYGNWGVKGIYTVCTSSNDQYKV